MPTDSDPAPYLINSLEFQHPVGVQWYLSLPSVRVNAEPNQNWAGLEILPAARYSVANTGWAYSDDRTWKVGGTFFVKAACRMTKQQRVINIGGRQIITTYYDGWYVVYDVDGNFSRIGRTEEVSCDLVYDPYSGTSSCRPSGGGGGGEGGGGSESETTCTDVYLKLEVNYNDGTGWHTLWEGWGKECS